MSDGLVIDVDDVSIVVVRETGDVIADVEDAPLRVDADAVGLPGAKGDKGDRGDAGPPGDGAADPGDLVLIFENHLI